MAFSEVGKRILNLKILNVMEETGLRETREFLTRSVFEAMELLVMNKEEGGLKEKIFGVEDQLVRFLEELSYSEVSVVGMNR